MEYCKYVLSSPSCLICIDGATSKRKTVAAFSAIRVSERTQTKVIKAGALAPTSQSGQLSTVKVDNEHSIQCSICKKAVYIIFQIVKGVYIES
jgi:hypothetical protein